MSLNLCTKKKSKKGYGGYSLQTHYCTTHNIKAQTMNFDEFKGRVSSLYSSSHRRRRRKKDNQNILQAQSVRAVLVFLIRESHICTTVIFWMCIKIWHLFYYTWLLNHNINNTCHFKWQPTCKATTFTLISVQNSQS